MSVTRIAFIDSRAADCQLLVAGLGADTAWFLINADEAGLAQMAQVPWCQEMGRARKGGRVRRSFGSCWRARRSASRSWRSIAVARGCKPIRVNPAHRRKQSPRVPSRRL